MNITAEVSNKRSELLAYKESLLSEIKEYDERIEKLQCVSRTDEDDGSISSDSEAEEDSRTNLMLQNTADLRTKREQLKTCLKATQDLTKLEILEWDVDILTEVPTVNGQEITTTEVGLWKLMNAKCRIDLVPFSINFYVYQPMRKYAALSYHEIHVVPIKEKHDKELSKSVLPDLGKPSDAIDVIRSYAYAFRSRRTTLSELSMKYVDGSLSMEPLDDGGFFIKYGNFLEIAWILQCKSSPFLPFHHRMKFNIEYLDPQYVKRIKQFYNQLLEPSTTTDERTMLLSNIIDICIEANGVNEPMETYDSEYNHKSSSHRNILELEDNIRKPFQFERNEYPSFNFIGIPKESTKKIRNTMYNKPIINYELKQDNRYRKTTGSLKLPNIPEVEVVKNQKDFELMGPPKERPKKRARNAEEKTKETVTNKKLKKITNVENVKNSKEGKETVEKIQNVKTDDANNDNKINQGLDKKSKKSNSKANIKNRKDRDEGKQTDNKTQNDLNNDNKENNEGKKTELEVIEKSKKINNDEDKKVQNKMNNDIKEVKTNKVLEVNKNSKKLTNVDKAKQGINDILHKFLNKTVDKKKTKFANVKTVSDKINKNEDKAKKVKTPKKQQKKSPNIMKFSQDKSNCIRAMSKIPVIKPEFLSFIKQNMSQSVTSDTTNFSNSSKLSRIPQPNHKLHKSAALSHIRCSPRFKKPGPKTKTTFTSAKRKT